MVERQFTQTVPVSTNPSSKIEISISCRNLVNLDILSVSDPEVHVFVRDSRQPKFAFIGKTEMVNNNLNPDFSKTFLLDYFFEKEQYIRFEVYDIDVGSQRDYIGVCETTISKLMSS